jgi:hypothetical protein
VYYIADYQLKLSYETRDSVFEGNDAIIILNSFLNIYYGIVTSAFLWLKLIKYQITTHELHLLYELQENIKKNSMLNLETINFLL